MFAVAVDQVARRLQGGLTLSSAIGFVVLYVPIWYAWVGYVIYTDRFGTDDLSDRLFTLAQIAAILVLAVRAHDALERGAPGYAIAYGAFRLILAVRYVLAAHFVPRVRRQAWAEAMGFGLAGALWIASADVPSPTRFILWALGFLVDFGSPFVVRGFHRDVRPDAEHLEERFGTFVNIVLGEGFIGLVDGMREIEWTPSAYVSAALALVLGFAIWWVYFETLDAAPARLVERKGRTLRYKLWLFSHLPIAAGIAAAGIGVGIAVNHATERALPDRHRWLIAGAIALCYAALAVLHGTYAMAGGGRYSRALAVRKAVTSLGALVIAVVGRGLSSAEVIAALALLSVSLVALDLWDRAHAT